jgi:HEAT repeat protein
VGDERAIDLLIDCLQDAESHIIQTVHAEVQWVSQSGSQVRCAAARALGKLGNQRAREPLRACLLDADKDLQSEAAKALEKLRHE